MSKTYVVASPPLTTDPYAEQVPPLISTLLAHLESDGMHAESLFAGDPEVHQLNEVIERFGSFEGEEVICRRG